MTNVTYESINDMIASLEIPYAYYQFPEGTEQPTPFLCFYYANHDAVDADNINYVPIVRLVIELYTDDKRFDLENKIHNLLVDNEIPYQQYESYIDTEQMLLNTYEMEVYLNG